MSKKLVGLICALSANVIWGFISISLRFLKDYQSDQILYYRILTSFIICWLYILIVNRAKIKQDIHVFRQFKGRGLFQLTSLIVLSGIFITLNWFSFIYVVNNVNLKSAAFAYMVCPLITAMGGFFLLKEKLTKIKTIGILIAIISIVILATGSFYEVMWSVAIAVFYSFFLIIQRVIAGINKFNMLGIQLLIALLIIIPLFFLYPKPIPSAISFWLDIIVISVIFTIIPLLLSLYALERLPSSTVGILIYINPVVSFTVAFLYFNEKIDSSQFFAYSILIIAVVIFNFKILYESFLKFKNPKYLKIQ
jgi:chloramphenicol-sensitive protein RarD